MKKFICFLALLISLSLVSCGKEEAPQETTPLPVPQTTEEITADNADKTISGSKNGVSDFITLLLQTYNKLNAEEYNEASCFNITTPEVAEIGASVFKFNNNTSAYLLYNGGVYKLGTVFGGNGLTDMVAVDINSDGVKELFYTYAFGSEYTRRAKIAFFDFEALVERGVEGNYRSSALMLDKTADNKIEVYDSDFYSFDGENNLVNFGLVKKDSVATITFNDKSGVTVSQSNPE